MEGMLKMVIRILRRHSIMLCACILACTVILTLLLKPANQQPEEKEPVAAVQEEYSETPVPDEPAEASREEGSDDPDNGHQED